MLVINLYKRELFNGLRCPEGRIFEDEFMAHKIIYKCKKITYVPIKLYYYVQRLSSILNSSFSIKKFDKVYALKDRADYFRNKNEKQLYLQSFKAYMDAFFWYYFKAKRELSNVDKELKELKRIFGRILLLLMNNPLINLKQKTILIMFFINPALLELFKNVKIGKYTGGI